MRVIKTNTAYVMSFFILLSGVISFVMLPESKALAGGNIKIGVLEEPKTMNIWLATDAWSNRVLSQIYHPLFIRDPKTLEPIPWLAEKAPEYDPTSLSSTVRLREARATGADTLITACPKCEIHLKCALSDQVLRDELQLEVKDLWAVAASHLA